MVSVDEVRAGRAVAGGIDRDVVDGGELGGERVCDRLAREVTRMHAEVDVAEADVGVPAVEPRLGEREASRGGRDVGRAVDRDVVDGTAGLDLKMEVIRIGRAT